MEQTLIKEHIVIVRDKKGELLQIFRNDKPATDEDIVNCLKSVKGGDTAFTDIVYRIGGKINGRRR